MICAGGELSTVEFRFVTAVRRRRDLTRNGLVSPEWFESVIAAPTSSDGAANWSRIARSSRRFFL